MKYPLRMMPIDMVWSEIRDNENNVVCDVKARYAENVFYVLSTGQTVSFLIGFGLGILFAFLTVVSVLLITG